MLHLESIIQTHCPALVDCKQLLLTLFNTEEHQQVVTKARTWLQTEAPDGHLDIEAWLREAMPKEEPLWDPNTEATRARLERYQLIFLQGVKAGAKKPSTWQRYLGSLKSQKRVWLISMKDYVKPSQFYTPFDSEAPQNQCMVNIAFVGQAQSDIRQKFQKLNGFTGKITTTLLEITNKVFVNRDQAARKEANRRMKQKAALLSAALG